MKKIAAVLACMLLFVTALTACRDLGGGNVEMKTQEFKTYNAKLSIPTTYSKKTTEKDGALYYADLSGGKAFKLSTYSRSKEANYFLNYMDLTELAEWYFASLSGETTYNDDKPFGEEPLALKGGLPNHTWSNENELSTNKGVTKSTLTVITSPSHVYFLDSWTEKKKYERSVNTFKKIAESFEEVETKDVSVNWTAQNKTENYTLTLPGKYHYLDAGETMYTAFGNREDNSRLIVGKYDRVEATTVEGESLFDWTAAKLALADANRIADNMEDETGTVTESSPLGELTYSDQLTGGVTYTVTGNENGVAMTYAVTAVSSVDALYVIDCYSETEHFAANADAFKSIVESFAEIKVREATDYFAGGQMSCYFDYGWERYDNTEQNEELVLSMGHRVWDQYIDAYRRVKGNDGIDSFAADIIGAAVTLEDKTDANGHSYKSYPYYFYPEGRPQTDENKWHGEYRFYDNGAFLYCMDMYYWDYSVFEEDVVKMNGYVDTLIDKVM